MERYYSTGQSPQRAVAPAKKKNIKYRYSCQILMKLELPQQIFGNYSNIKSSENPSRRSQVVPCGQTDSKT
jgi:hypothetical protein